MSAIKDKIDSVINTYGSNVTLRTITKNPARDAWGKPVVDSNSDATIKAVKDNNFKNNFILNQSGRMDAGTSNIIVKADNTFDSETNKIIMDGKTYNILQVESLELSGEVLAKLVSLGEN